MLDYLKLLRVHHYMKNFLVFAALIFSRSLFELGKLRASIVAFVAFCMVSSAVYILNDIRDVEKDRLHPTKKNRPLAKESISIRTAWILVAILLIIAAICNVLVFHVESTILIAVYLLINMGYSFGWKDIPLLDVAILVSGFLIRILYGAVVAGISVSNWLYLTVLAVSFFFAFGKRRNEYQNLPDKDTRRVLKAYPVGFLDKSMYMCLTLSVVFYTLWTMDSNTVSFYNNNHLVFTVPIVLLIILRYSMDVEGDSDGDPVEVLLHDKVLILFCLLYVILMFVFLYVWK